MIEINVNKVNKNYGFNQVLNNLSFTLKTNEKIALMKQFDEELLIIRRFISDSSISSNRFKYLEDSTKIYLDFSEWLKNETTF